MKIEVGRTGIFENAGRITLILDTVGLRQWFGPGACRIQSTIL